MLGDVVHQINDFRVYIDTRCVDGPRNMSKNDANSIENRVEVAIDMGLNRPVAVFRPSKAQPNRPKEQNNFKDAHAFTLLFESWTENGWQIVAVAVNAWCSKL
ncbi:hypothetical protein MP228_007554 [Amoeboaphelidium protococcarum]|nr:hypothetical protein MP228_007554 [Amoeboaphelidium protococcarum]